MKGKDELKAGVDSPGELIHLKPGLGEYRVGQTPEQAPAEVAIEKPKPPTQVVLSWHFHPDNEEGNQRQAPEWFLKEMKMISEDLKVNWHPLYEQWQVWVRDATIGATNPNTEYCRGWRRLFMWAGELDRRVFFVLYDRDAQRFGGAKGAYEEWLKKFHAQNEAVEAESDDEAIQKAREWWAHTRISNLGKGNKFSKYHGGAF